MMRPTEASHVLAGSGKAVAVYDGTVTKLNRKAHTFELTGTNPVTDRKVSYKVEYGSFTAYVDAKSPGAETGGASKLRNGLKNLGADGMAKGSTLKASDLTFG